MGYSTDAAHRAQRHVMGDEMVDITMLILADHGWFREQFARLDYLQADESVSPTALQRVWRPLADKLDVHAYIEEEIFYPQLLRQGVADPEAETLDAIGDHNDIRDGVRAADEATTGSAEWWAAVGETREANDEHMGEEEREGLSDFRRHASVDLLTSLGHQYRDFMARHPTTTGLKIVDRDPQTYVENVVSAPKDASLGIGSLKRPDAEKP